MRLTTDGVRATGREHPVKHRYANGYLSMLGGEITGMQARADERLVTTHYRFDPRAFAVTGGHLPGQPPLCLDHLEVAVSLCGLGGARNYAPPSSAAESRSQCRRHVARSSDTWERRRKPHRR